MINYIDIDVWQNSIVFIVEPTLQEFDRFYYNNTIRMSDEEYKAMRDDIKDPRSCMGYTIVISDGGLVIFLREAYKFLFSAHEILHACLKMLMKRGVTIDEDSEPLAYTIGLVTDWYVRWICEERKMLTFVPADMVKDEYKRKIGYKEEKK